MFLRGLVTTLLFAAIHPHLVLAAAGSVLPDVDTSESEMRGVIHSFTADSRSLHRFYSIEGSKLRRERLNQFYSEWLDRLGKVNFDVLGPDGRIDYLLLANDLTHQLRSLDLESKAYAEIQPLVPFANTIIDLEESRQRMEPLDAEKAAGSLDGLRKQIEDSRKAVEAETKKSGGADSKAEALTKKPLANRATVAVDRLRATLKRWYGFYNGYDPLFTWWAAEPYKTADKALESYAKYLRETVVGVKPEDKETIIGDPVGRESLLADLAHEMIPYTPEELIAIANQELAWCENEMKRASRDLGYGDNWHKALEHVKTLHVEPGKQPALVRDLAQEAVRFLDQHDLVTVPKLARETWRMEMMSPERQLVNPFFTGGEVISVAFPTSTMSHEQKLMSMRGNNIHFSRATVFHELIPGHELQGFVAARYRPYRWVFSTPFSVEGWALYWELLLWDMDFARSPEDRVGMLFWRMHRCARIIFSLSFHLGKMTPQECIDLLVNRVGHEREDAAGEVRRSFEGSYSPLYQCAYLLGGLQIRALHRELTGPGKMTNREFHDTFLREKEIPVELVRARLTGQKLSRDFRSSWKFYGEVAAR
jgi:uncharacterized protein (DUF885 family)